jgi:uncharacterized protein
MQIELQRRPRQSRRCFFSLTSDTKTPMTTPFLYTASVPVFTQMLQALGGLLEKAQAHAAAKNIEPQALLQARLFPDMFALQRQVVVAADFASSVCARLAGVEVPPAVEIGPGFEGLQQRLGEVTVFIQSLDATQFAGREALEVVLRAGTPKEKRLLGTQYLLNYGLPQFFFHATTAYALLRHNGVEIGKKDYMGVY